MNVDFRTIRDGDPMESVGMVVVPNPRVHDFGALVIVSSNGISVVDACTWVLYAYVSTGT